MCELTRGGCFCKVVAYLSMAFSQEFFNQRSFEVVWAVFRVAERASRIRMKEGLEDRALNYILTKDIDSLVALEEIIHLAFRIGEVSHTNTEVLLREIVGLKDIIVSLEEERSLLPESGKKDDFHVEEIIARAPSIYSEFLSLQEVQKSPAKSGNENNQQNKVFSQKSSTIEQSPAKDKKDDFSSRTNTLPESGKKEDKKVTSFGIQEEVRQSPAKVRQSSENDENSGDLKSSLYRERHAIIMDLLAKRALCHINDVLNLLPEVSRRTVRYDIQKLVDEGVVERVGSGGPNSFFRLKKHQEQV